MEWKDYDDFEKKYGSDYNLDNYAKRMSVCARAYIPRQLGSLWFYYPVKWR